MHHFGVTLDEFSLGWLRDEVEALVAREGWTPDVCMRLNLVLEELSLNVRDHGGVDAGRMDFSVELVHGGLRVCFSDDGVGFDVVQEAPAVDVGAGLEARHVGGLGLHLVHAMVDGLRYERVCGLNRVEMVLPWQKSGGALPE